MAGSLLAWLEAIAPFNSRFQFRNLLLGTLGRIPAFRRRLAWRLSGLVNRPRDGAAPGVPALTPR